MPVPERAASYAWASPDPFAWMDEAACTGVSVDVFFPERGDSYAEARAVCSTCPVQEPCRDEIDRAERSLRGVDVQGLYAGETPGERRRRRADRAAANVTLRAV